MAAVRLPDGTIAMVCGPRRRSAPCQVPRCSATSSKLCDWPTDGKKTCDLKLCAGCATKIGPDRDLCPAHFAMYQER